MKARIIALASAVGVLLLALATTLPSRAQAPAGAAKLGKVNFPVSCNAAAQKEFEIVDGVLPLLRLAAAQGLARPRAPGRPVLRHGPLGPGAGAPRQSVRAGRAACSPKVLADGQAAIDAARAAGLKTQRERDYVDALAVFFKDADKLNHRTRAVALEDRHAGGGRAVPRGHRGDDPARAGPLGDLRSGRQEVHEPAEGGEDARARSSPSSRSTLASRTTSSTATTTRRSPPRGSTPPGAMPRSRRTRPTRSTCPRTSSRGSGYWKDSVESNRQSARVDGDRTANSPHAYDYMVYAQLQLGQDKAAAEVLTHAVGVATKADHVAAAYAYAAMPARLALERGAWAGGGEAAAGAGRRGLSLEEVPAGGGAQRVRPRRGRGHER